jgi:hypothetical protein
MGVGESCLREGHPEGVQVPGASSPAFPPRVSPQLGLRHSLGDSSLTVVNYFQLIINF